MLQPVSDSSCHPTAWQGERLWFVQLIHLQVAFNVLFFWLSKQVFALGGMEQARRPTHLPAVLPLEGG